MGEAPRIGVLGLGTMGLPAATRLAACGAPTTGYDPVPEAADRARAHGVAVAASAGEAVASSDVVLLVLPRPEHVEDAVGGPLRAATEGTLVVDLSTVGPSTSRAAGRALRERSVSFVDSPVLGRPDGCGSWTLVAGGRDEDVARWRGVAVGAVARQVEHVGEVGAGAVVKVLNNLMLGTINAVTAEALTACRRAGVEPARFVEAVAGSGAASVSPLFRDVGPRMVEERYDDPTFALGLMQKDNRLALDLAREVGAPTVIADVVDRLNSAAVQAGLGDLDTSGLLRLYTEGGASAPAGGAG